MALISSALPASDDNAGGDPLADVLADLETTIQAMVDQGIAWEHIAPLASLQLEGLSFQFYDAIPQASWEGFLARCQGATVALEMQIVEAKERRGAHA